MLEKLNIVFRYKQMEKVDYITNIKQVNVYDIIMNILIKSYYWEINNVMYVIINLRYNHHLFLKFMMFNLFIFDQHK